MEKEWIQWILPTDGGQLKSAIGPKDHPLTIWGTQGEKAVTFIARGPVLDMPAIGRVMALGWQQGAEVSPSLRIAPPSTAAPWGILYQLEVISSEGEHLHVPSVSMNPLEALDLTWQMNALVCEILTQLGFQVGSLMPDGRPGGLTVLVSELKGSASHLFERLLLFRAGLETIASARGFQVQSIQLQTDARGIVPIDGQLLGMDF